MRTDQRRFDVIGRFFDPAAELRDMMRVYARKDT